MVTLSRAFTVNTSAGVQPMFLSRSTSAFSTFMSTLPSAAERSVVVGGASTREYVSRKYPPVGTNVMR